MAKRKAFGESEGFHKRAYKHETRVLRKTLREARDYLSGETPIGGTRKCAWAFEALLKAAEARGELSAHGTSGEFAYRWRGGYKGSRNQHMMRGTGIRRAMKAAVSRFHRKCVLADRE